MYKKIEEIFLDLVKISSPSGYEDGIREYIINFISSCPVSYEIDNYKNLIVNYHGNSNQILLFDAHMDTVGPCEQIIPVIKDDIIYSDGNSILGADDKAGIAACLYLIQQLTQIEVPIYSLRFIFSVSEEVGLQGAKHLDDKYLKDVLYAFALDGEGKPGSVVNKTPYTCKGGLTFIGREAHAGVCPENGINALYVASHAICEMPNGRINENTTCNIGVIEGGIATNVVMPQVNMQFEARSYIIEELEQLIDKVIEIGEKTADRFEAQFTSDLKFGTKGYNVKEEDSIICFLKTVCERCELPFALESCGGGSNANVYRQRGINALNLGVGMQEVHTCNEFIEIKSLMEMTKLLNAMIQII